MSAGKSKKPKRISGTLQNPVKFADNFISFSVVVINISEDPVIDRGRVKIFSFAGKRAPIFINTGVNGLNMSVVHFDPTADPVAGEFDFPAQTAFPDAVFE
jgi:hypothetical protein